MNGCIVDPGVHVEVGPENAATILGTIPAAGAMFEGHTPTLDGLRDAVEYMKSLEDPNAEAIVLVVDGDTNCDADNMQVADVAADAFANEVPVYVVGVDLTDAIANELTGVAMKGGTEKVFNSSDADALQDALESLIREIGNCTIPLKPDPPMYPKYVDVVVDGDKVPWVPGVSSCDDAADEGMADGWVYTTDKAPWDEIELCGSFCQQYLETLEVDVTYECPPPS